MSITTLTQCLYTSHTTVMYQTNPGCNVLTVINYVSANRVNVVILCYLIQTQHLHGGMHVSRPISTYHLIPLQMAEHCGVSITKWKGIMGYHFKYKGIMGYFVIQGYKNNSMIAFISRRA